MTIYEIARKAGVSVATVSRVINNNKNVRQSTREKILKVIEEEEYFPNSLAQGLSSSSTRDIGILLIDVRQLYFSEVVHSIEQEISQQGYSSILCNTGGSLDDQRNYLALLMQKQVSAIILVGSVFNYEKLQKSIEEIASRIPVIIINESLQGENIYSVSCDESHGVQEAIKYLHELGHRKFIYIKEADTYSARRKLRGFIKGMERFDIPNESYKVIQSSGGVEGGRVAGEVIVGSESPYTAIITEEDITAVGVIQTLETRGFTIPEDYSVIGFNNSLYTECSTPRISSIDSQMTPLGLNAARLCMDILQKRPVSAKNVILPELVLKESTGPAISSLAINQKFPS
ncbi:LacI family DNA-binding transcriptional regulator [Spirochaeta cellobiosiphila]|uniref:LacI family DNA-binding transcriptional regulator n=1 Tax=Spirochaeta cellobiosiphila TaxID=504483 RepID=UPI000400C951|nr:LacI family DNA-binding transcriptional regulator [Spirochaeta cellobiosiphila]